jgi:hypothetical protein
VDAVAGRGSRFAFFPLAFAVFRTRSVLLAIVVHVIANSFDVIGWLSHVL